MADYSRSYFQQEKSMARHPDPTSRNQNGRREPTSVRDEVDRRVHVEQHQPMALHVSRGNPEAVARTHGNPEAVAHHPHPRGNPEAVAHHPHPRGNPEAVAHHPHPLGNPKTVAYTRGNPEAVAHHPYTRGNPEAAAHYLHTRGNPEMVPNTRGNPETVAHASGNPEAVAHHPGMVTLSMSYAPYSQTPPRTTSNLEHRQYSPSFPNPAQSGNARFYLAQHVNRRNSTGTLRHYPSNVNGNGAAGYGDERHVDFVRQFHHNVLLESNDLSHPPNEGHSTSPRGQYHVVGTPPSRFVVPTSVSSTKSPSLIRQSSVPAGFSVSPFTADLFRRRARFDSHSVTEPIPKVPVAMAPATGEKDPVFYRPPSQTSEIVTSRGCAGDTRESTQYIEESSGYRITPEYTKEISGCRDTWEYTKERSGYKDTPGYTKERSAYEDTTGYTMERSGYEDTLEYTEESLGCKDTPEYTRGKSGYKDIPEYTKETWGPEDTLVRKKLESTKRRRLRKKELSTVVVISESEGEEEFAEGRFSESSPSGDWEDSGSDVFPFSECGQQSPVSEPVMLLGGLITNRTKVKSERLSESEQTCCASDSRDVDSLKGRHRSVVSEDENTKDSSEKKSVVVGERTLSNEVKRERNAEHCIDDCEKSFAEDFRVTNENTSRVVANGGRNSSSHQRDFNNNDFHSNWRMAFSYHEPAIPPVSVNTVRGNEMAVHAKLGGNICRPEKATREECRCDPSRTAKCSCCEFYSRSIRSSSSTGRGNFDLSKKNSGDLSKKNSGDLSKKNSGDPSKRCAACSSINRSSSPTFGFLTRQLSKLTDDEMQTEIKKGECVGDAATRENTRGRENTHGMENARGRETREAKSPPCGVCAKIIYGTDKIHGNLQPSTKSETPDEYNRDYSAAKYECPGTKCKLGDVTSQKAVNKPTGIVVGVKKDRRVEEPLVSKTADAKEFEKHDGGKTKCGQKTNDGSENAEKAAMRNEFSRSFGVLQFSVVEKDVDPNLRNGHECPKSPSGSRGDEITATQQWQAYSVKLERSSTRTQCDVDERNELLGEGRKGKMHRRDASEQSVLKDMRQGEIFRNVDTKERDVLGSIVANSTQQDTSLPKFEKKCGSDTFAVSGFRDIKSADTKNVGDSRETRAECNEAVRKRSSSSDANEDCGRTRSPEKRRKVSFEKDGGDYRDDCTKTYFAEESKREKAIEGSVVYGEDYGEKKTNTANCERMAKLSLSEQPRANDEEKSNCTHIPPRPQAQEDAAAAVGGNAVEIPRKTPESNDLGDVSTEQTTSPVDGTKLPEKKGGALTAGEWKEILIGRIEQVRVSIETEQTPWKTKNKMKVLKKLENQLVWWDEQDEQAFLSRKLQFFQTMRSQYELMKQIGAQRRTSTNNTGKKAPERTTMMDDNPKTKVLTVANVTKEKKKYKVAKKQSKVAKKKTNTSTG